MENNEQPKTKVCKKCGQELPLEYFSKNSRAKDGLQIYCRDCQKALVKARRERDKDNLRKICQEEINGNSEEDGRKNMWYEKAEARIYLEALPDSEILTEIRRRGYVGRIFKKIEVVL